MRPPEHRAPPPPPPPPPTPCPAAQSKSMLSVKAHDADVNVIAWNRSTTYMLVRLGGVGGGVGWGVLTAQPVRACKGGVGRDTGQQGG